MKANKFLLAARHACASGAPIETFAEDTSEVQQMTPAAAHPASERGCSSTW